MNPTNQVQQPIQRFTPANDAVYNTLRDTLQRHIAGGVPGLDKVVDSLNKQHVSMMQNYRPLRPQGVAPTQTPVQNSIGALNDMMGKIRQQNAPALPNGYNAYS